MPLTTNWRAIALSIATIIATATAPVQDYYYYFYDKLEVLDVSHVIPKQGVKCNVPLTETVVMIISMQSIQAAPPIMMCRWQAVGCEIIEIKLIDRWFRQSHTSSGGFEF